MHRLIVLIAENAVMLVTPVRYVLPANASYHARKALQIVMATV